jgi:hypothetical protein
MSTTNPDPGRPTEPVSGLTHHPPGSPPADNHGGSGPPDPATIARGHEVDAYDAVSVLSVPLMVILFFVLAFGTVTVIFYFIAPSVTDPGAHPQAVERNSEDLNKRLDRIHRGGEVDQPRLEPLKLRAGEARAITRPDLPTGNSPELHPEDLRPSPTNTPELFRGGWADPGKTVGRLTIDDAGRGFGPSKAEPPPVPGEPAQKDQKKDQPPGKAPDPKDKGGKN